MSDIPGYDGWKLRAPEDDQPSRPFGWMRCEECNGSGAIDGATCENCAGCGGVEVDEDDLDWSEA